MAVLRFEALREFDRLTDPGRARSRPAGLPMDILRRGDELILQFDLPGADPATVDVTVEKNVLSVTAERRHDRHEGDELVVAERPSGRVTRRLQLGDGLDTERVTATFDAGVLTVAFPTAEEVRARRIDVRSAAAPTIAAASGDAPEAVADTPAA